MSTSFNQETQSHELSFRSFIGTEISTVVEKLARLRMEVFQEYPYLYGGDLEYEQEYLRPYAAEVECLVILLECAGEVVGATTCLPLKAADVEFQKPFIRAGIRTDEVFYFGESIIRAPFRGRGTGREFFLRREAHAKQLGYPHATFCSVNRDPAHPLRPENYRPLDEFWKRLGYQHRSELSCQHDWREVGQKEESTHTLSFWWKDLNADLSSL